MKRRDFIAGGCAVPLVAGAGPLMAGTVEKDDHYWEMQWVIGEYEQELQELRTHSMIMSKRD